MWCSTILTSLQQLPILFKLELKYMRIIIPVYVALILACGGCSTWSKFDDTEKGAVIGGGTGAVLGNLVAPGVGGTVIGGALGAVGGGVIGHENDDEKKKR
jgi:hypothetical protein